MNTENIDYETKIITPTKQLYQQFSTQANELFAHAKEYTLDLHAKVAESSLEFYSHPTETATRWQAEATEKGNELYATFNTEIVPAVKADYQLLVSTATDFSEKTQAALQIFLDNPEKVTVETFTAVNQALVIFLDKTMDTSTILLKEISSQADEIISLLIEQPIQTMENLYYDSLAVLLNSYFELISSLLVSI